MIAGEVHNYTDPARSCWPLGTRVPCSNQTVAGNWWPVSAVNWLCLAADQLGIELEQDRKQTATSSFEYLPK
jgi:hypothetical protein